MAKKTSTSNAPAADAAGEASSQGPLNTDQAARIKTATDARALIEQAKKDKAKRMEKFGAALTTLAKEYEAKLGGLIVPFKDGAGQEWPAVVIGLEEKRMPKLGLGRTAIVARVLVLSGRAQQPYQADLELADKKED